MTTSDIKITELLVKMNRTCEALIKFTTNENTDKIRITVEKLKDELDTLRKFDEIKQYTELLNSLEFPIFKLLNNSNIYHPNDIKLHLITIGTIMIEIGKIRLD